MSASAKIIELRQLLAERFPHAPRAVATTPAHALATGVPGLDALLGGGLPRGEFTELVGQGSGSGTAQILHALVRQVAADGQFLALVDGADSFDVDAPEPAALARLLWVRCHRATEALQATDLLLRDANFPLIVLDLKLNPARELRKISSTVWFRFRRLLAQHQPTVLLITPFALASGVAARVEVRGGLDAHALAAPTENSLAQLHFELLRATPQLAEPRLAQAG